MPERHPKPWESGSGWDKKTHIGESRWLEETNLLKQHVWLTIYDMLCWCAFGVSILGGGEGMNEGIMDVRIHQSDLKFWRRWYDIKKRRIIPSIVHNRKQGRVGENECSDITQTPQVLLVVCKSTHKEIQEMLWWISFWTFETKFESLPDQDRLLVGIKDHIIAYNIMQYECNIIIYKDYFYWIWYDCIILHIGFCSYGYMMYIYTYMIFVHNMHITYCLYYTWFFSTVGWNWALSCCIEPKGLWWKQGKQEPLGHPFGRTACAAGDLGHLFKWWRLFPCDGVAFF